MRPSPFNKQSGVAKTGKAAAGPSKLGGGAKAAAAPAAKGKAKKVVDDSEVGVLEEGVVCCLGSQLRIW